MPEISWKNTSIHTGTYWNFIFLVTDQCINSRSSVKFPEKSVTTLARPQTSEMLLYDTLFVFLPVCQVRDGDGPDIHCECPESGPANPRRGASRRLLRLRRGRLQGVAEGEVIDLFHTQVRRHADVHDVQPGRTTGGRE